LAQDTEAVDEVLRAVRESTGITDEAFGAMADTGALKFAKAVQKAKVTAMEFYDSLKSALTPVLERLTKVLEQVQSYWQSLSPEMQQAAVAAAAAAAAIGPLLVAVGFATTGIGGLVSALATLKVAVTALAASPAFLAIGTTVAAAVVVWQAFRNEVKSTSQVIGEMIRESQRNYDRQMQTIQSLRGLASQQNLTNEQMGTAKGLIRELEAAWGDLGISIDTATRSIQGADKALAEAQRRALEQQARRAKQTWDIALKNWEGIRSRMEKSRGGLVQFVMGKIDLSQAEKAATAAEQAYREASGALRDFNQRQKEIADVAQEQERASRIGWLTALRDGYNELTKAMAKQNQTAQNATKSVWPSLLDIMDSYSDQMEKGRRLVEQYLTPAEKFAKTQRELLQLLIMGAIPEETFNRAITDAREQMEAAGREADKLDRDVDLRFHVSGVQAVAAGSAEALAHLAEYQARASRVVRPPAEPERWIAPHLANVEAQVSGVQVPQVPTMEIPARVRDLGMGVERGPSPRVPAAVTPFSMGMEKGGGNDLRRIAESNERIAELLEEESQREGLEISTEGLR
jgi:hypothetical protein